MKKFAVYVSEIRCGCVHVEAETPDEAKNKALELYNSRSIDFYEEECSDLTAEEE